MATKIAGIIATSMRTSQVDSGFDYGFYLNRLISVAPYAAGMDTTRACLGATSGLERAITCYSQSLTGQTRLVLVVSEICTGGYGAGGVGEGCTRGKERLVGRSTPNAAVGVAEEEQVSGAWQLLPDHSLSPHYVQCSNSALPHKTSPFMRCFSKVLGYPPTILFYILRSLPAQVALPPYLSPWLEAFLPAPENFREVPFSLNTVTRSSYPHGTHWHGIWARKCTPYASNLPGQDQATEQVLI
jgi:hypothetical protein